MICERAVYWWAEDITTFCGRPVRHDGLHYDGLRHFDDNGLQRPTELAGVVAEPRRRFINHTRFTETRSN